MTTINKYNPCIDCKLLFDKKEEEGTLIKLKTDDRINSGEGTLHHQYLQKQQGYRPEEF